MADIQPDNGPSAFEIAYKQPVQEKFSWEKSEDGSVCVKNAQCANGSCESMGNVSTTAIRSGVVSGQTNTTTICFATLAFSLAGLTMSLDTALTSAALPIIENELSMTSMQYSWAGSAYFIAGGCLLPLWMPISDVTGRKWFVVSAMGFRVGGTLLCAFATNATMLLTGRTLEGMATYAFLSILPISIDELYKHRNTAVPTGLYFTAVFIGYSLAPIVSGVLSHFAAWKYIFILQFAFELVCAVLVLFFFRNTALNERLEPIYLRYVDYSGVFLLSSSVCLFLVGLQFGGIHFPWNSATVLGLLVCGSLSLLVLILQQTLSDCRILPSRVFADRSRAAILIMSFTHGFVGVACLFYLPIYFYVNLGANALQTGLWLLATTIPSATIAVAVGTTVHFTGHYRFFVISGNIMLTAGIGILINLSSYLDLPRIVFFQVILATGIGALLPAIPLAMEASSAVEDVKLFYTVLVLFRALGAGVGIIVGQLLLQNVINSYIFSLKTAGLAESLVEDLPRHINAFRSAGGLTVSQRGLIEQVLTNALSQMWTLYTAVAGIGVLASFFIQHRTLPKERSIRVGI